MTGPWPWLLTASSIHQLVQRRAQATPDALLLVDEHGASLTCREFANEVEQVAAGLRELGIGQGSRVAWQLPTRMSTLLVMIALRRLGAVQAPIIPLYREREVSVALAASQAEHFLTPGVWQEFDFSAMARGIVAAGGPSPLVTEIGPDAPRADVTPPLPGTSPDDPAWIYFTSGSTGVPKGALHSDRTLLAGAIALAGMSRQGEADGDMGSIGFPVAHVGGIEYLLAALAGGFPLLLMEAFVPERAVELYRQHGVTATGGAPPFYQALLALARSASPEPLVPTLRLMVGGGAPCPPELFRAVRDIMGVTIAHDYGMTEIPMIAVGDPRDAHDLLEATDGRLVPGNLIRALGSDGSEVSVGDVGELQVSGAAVCLGYTDEAETQAAFTHDGWFRTGDLGRIHSTGHIEVVGRAKDMIIRKGENVAPQELEELIQQHPDVAEVSVIGVPDPDRGELVCAIVVPAPGCEAPGVAVLSAWLLSMGLMRQKVPERVEAIAVLPRTGLAKVDKVSLRNRFAPSL